MIDKLCAARRRLWVAQERFSYFPDINIIINDVFSFNFNTPEAVMYYSQTPPYLKCHLKPSMLEDILDRKAHWNNAELGCHIMFDRKPDTYMHDVHMLMSFFHV